MKTEEILKPDSKDQMAPDGREENFENLSEFVPDWMMDDTTRVKRNTGEGKAEKQAETYDNICRYYF